MYDVVVVREVYPVALVSDTDAMFKASPRWITVIVAAAGTATTSPIKMAMAIAMRMDCGSSDTSDSRNLVNRPIAHTVTLYLKRDDA
jgi:hypothetical protein